MTTTVKIMIVLREAHVLKKTSLSLQWYNLDKECLMEGLGSLKGLMEPPCLLFLPIPFGHDTKVPPPAPTPDI